MKMLIRALALWACMGAPAFAQVGMGVLPFGGAAASAGCSDANATAWKNAVVTAGGTVSTGQITNVCNLIVAYKAAGVWSLLDREWLYASENPTQASIDIVNLGVHTLVGTPTFTINRGYQPVIAAADYINTNYISGPNYSQNSASFGAYVINNRTTGGGDVALGTTGSSGGQQFFRPYNSSGVIEFDINGAAFPNDANTTAAGNYIFSRTSSSLLTAYKNAGAFTGQSSSSLPISTFSFYVFAYNNGGVGPGSASLDQIASAFMGGALTGTQAAAKNAALNAYMTAVGANVY